MHNEAIKCWVNYCRRFGISPHQLIGLTYPGHEKVRVDRQLANDIQKSLDQIVGN